MKKVSKLNKYWTINKIKSNQFLKQRIDKHRCKFLLNLDHLKHN